jgi:hypothetical protein
MTGPGLSRTGPAAAPGLPQSSPVDPPERHINWLSSYDEEWAKFVHKQSLQRTSSGFNHRDPDARPRVWNCPMS